ncbi:MAG: hypothetical protein ACYDDR_10895 [Acidithiobacillus ferrivorans]
MVTFLIIVIIGLLVVAALRMSGNRPKEENVVQRWGAYLPGKKEAGEEYLKLAEQEFINRNTDFGQERINFGLVGKDGPALRIKYSPTYSSYITYDTTGDDLSLHYVLYRRGDFIYAIPFIGPLFFRLFNNVFVHDHNKLIGFASMTLDCAKEAAGTLMDKFNIDRAKIKPSSGKFGQL